MRTFAAVCEQIAATTKKLEKERILSDYLHTLSDVDLAIACTFLSGGPFPLRDQRTTNVGFTAVRNAILQVVPEGEERLSPLLVRTGDLGIAVAELLQRKAAVSTLKLKDVLSYYEQLTTANSQQTKKELTVDILNRATPLEAKYILKILLGGMRIGLQESLVESSIDKAFGRSLSQIQRSNMLLGDIGECSLLAKYDRLSEAHLRLLHPLKVMLASPEEDAENILESMNGEGLAEDKYDGIRAQIHKQDQQIKIFSRDLDDITGSFPDLVNPISVVEGSFLMDGEIIPFKDGNILGFSALQTRLGRKTLSTGILEAVPCRYFAFDLLYHKGELLIDLPLRVRRGRLEQIQGSHPESFSMALQRVVRTLGDLEVAFEESRKRNNEGLVIKDPGSTYVPGKRGKSWLKLKRAMVTLDVVVTVAEYGHGKRRGLLSDYTFAVQHQGKLLEIGKAYSGITDQELNQLSDLFHRLSIRQEGYYHVVQPQVVLEVAFDRINRSSRHASGFALRFPRIKRIRWDKTSEEIDTLETVEKLYQQYFR